MKASDNEYPSVLFEEQAGDPATPASGFWRLYFKDDGIYLINDAGSVTGPLATSAGYPPFSGARYATDAAQTITNNTTVAIINFDGQIYDTDSAVTTGAGWKYTAPATGYYHLDCGIEFAGSSGWAAGERGLLQLFKNNSNILELDRRDFYVSGGSLVMRLYGHATIALDKDDYIDIRIAQNSGGDLQLANDQKKCWINIERVG